MEITGTQSIFASRQRVWDALNDPDILKRCLPGCESVLRTSAEEFKVVIAAAIGPLRARFNGVLRMSDAQAPASCTMVFEGQGGAVGFGKGNSSVTLTETNGQTELAYTAQAQVGGKLAQVGSRLIDSVARKMADDFFKAFKAQLAEPSPPTVLAVDAAAGKDAPTAPAPGSAQAARSSSAVSVAPSQQTAAAMPRPTASEAQAAGGAVPAQAMVPGWWLGVAAVLGSAMTLIGALVLR